MAVKNGKKGMPMRAQIFLWSTGLILFVVILSFLINTFFLRKVYVEDRIRSIRSAYSSFNQASNQGELDTEEYEVEFRRICDKCNISVIIMDSNSTLMVSSTMDHAFLMRSLMDYLFTNGAMSRNENIRVREQTQNYTLQIVKDPRMEGDYIEMWGVLDTGSPFLIRSGVESMRDSARISNLLLLYVSIAVLLLGFVYISIVAKRITGPLKDLSHISERMAHLDFEARYEKKSSAREIDQLGHNINELSNALEHTISELKSANVKLQADIREKEKIDEMRREFLSNVTHELKTPIALIQGYAEGLKEGMCDDPESMGYYCDVIVDESAKMNTMVQKLLTLNHLEFGDTEQHVERFDLAEMVNNYLQTADILIRQKEATVRFEQGTPVYVWADEFQAEEVLMNYFTNALNHLEGERIVDIRISQENGKARLSVFNTGEPIPEDSVDRIWEKFYKVDKARTREYGGSGVGLSIVKAIMDGMHQGYGVKNYDNGVAFWAEFDTSDI